MVQVYTRLNPITIIGYSEKKTESIKESIEADQICKMGTQYEMNNESPEEVTYIHLLENRRFRRIYTIPNHDFERLYESNKTSFSKINEYLRSNQIIYDHEMIENPFCSEKASASWCITSFTKANSQHLERVLDYYGKWDSELILTLIDTKKTN